MSGVWKNVMSLLCAGVLPPSAFTVASIELVSNAALFQLRGERLARPQPAGRGDERQQRHAAARPQYFPALHVHGVHSHLITPNSTANGLLVPNASALRLMRPV